jgi:hypothetical protein
MRFAQLVNVFLVPLLVIIAGLLLAWRRRRVKSGASSGRAPKKQTIKESEMKEPENDV